MAAETRDATLGGEVEVDGAAFGGHVRPANLRVDRTDRRLLANRSGGRRDQVLAASGLAEALPRVADDLLHQYVVTYGRPDKLVPPEKIQVTVSRPGATVRARTRISGR